MWSHFLNNTGHYIFKYITLLCGVAYRDGMQISVHFSIIYGICKGRVRIINEIGDITFIFHRY